MIYLSERFIAFKPAHFQQVSINRSLRYKALHGLYELVNTLEYLFVLLGITLQVTERISCCVYTGVLDMQKVGYNIAQ